MGLVSLYSLVVILGLVPPQPVALAAAYLCMKHLPCISSTLARAAVHSLHESKGSPFLFALSGRL